MLKLTVGSKKYLTPSIAPSRVMPIMKRPSRAMKGNTAVTYTTLPEVLIPGRRISLNCGEEKDIIKLRGGKRDYH